MDTKSFHLEGQPAPEGLLTGVSLKGEFHEINKSASEALLGGVARRREIHLWDQCASEGIVEGVGSEGEFHVTDLKESEEDILRIEPAVTASKGILAGGWYSSSAKV